MSPSTRILGRCPATMWRSEASFLIISSSRARRFTGIPSSPSGSGFLHDFLERRDAPLHFHPPVHAEREHPLFDGLLAQLLRGGPFQHHAPQGARHRHHLVQPLPPLVPA